MKHPGAQYELGLIYTQRSDIPDDARCAAEWFEKAASMGYPASRYVTGVMYCDERYGKKRINRKTGKRQVDVSHDLW